MVILLKATARVSSMDQSLALFLLQAKWEIIFFFRIPESSQASIVWFSSLFPFVPIWTSVWGSELHTNLFRAFFFAWLGVITLFHFIFINLPLLLVFDLLSVLIVSVRVRGSKHARVPANRKKFCIYVFPDWWQSLGALCRAGNRDLCLHLMLVRTQCTQFSAPCAMSQRHRQGAPTAPTTRRPYSRLPWCGLEAKYRPGWEQWDGTEIHGAQPWALSLRGSMGVSPVIIIFIRCHLEGSTVPQPWLVP